MAHCMQGVDIIAVDMEHGVAPMLNKVRLGRVHEMYCALDMP